MGRFLIGQYGAFDPLKFGRDYRKGFFGIEACLLQTDEDIAALRQAAIEHSFQVGIHFPLRDRGVVIRDALFLSQDSEERSDAYRRIQEELDSIKMLKLNPAYILFHYPKPVILDDRVNWSTWHFSDRREYAYERDYSFEVFELRTEELFQWLTDQSKIYGFVPVLEFDALNRYVYDSEFLEKLLQKYPAVRLCLDTGRLYLQERRDPFFKSIPLMRRYAKYAEVIHLWNLQYNDGFVKLRYPVLPEQLPQEGWAPIAEYLHIIREENPDVKIQFEHRSDLVSEVELERCYCWVSDLLTDHN
ncbi:sugar phosphate isomerase/epimerase [Paenibacillus sp. HJL G12]|uniref:Sugar phosphate isomerase/epimerase n=1 Tax=Paenibacillus dendrobii TaxID=2691084 RepID=A0A7X3LGM9_9BACL|nr:sugar phosphate isomerase/epimerase [Paenibacillus dendrobii]MWV44257.1 sugar phosphate isomerase/epimerase [Paenibacillus dendrobii]